MKGRVFIVWLGFVLVLLLSGCRSGAPADPNAEPTMTPIPFTVIQPTPTVQIALEGGEDATAPAPTTGPTPSPTLPAPSGVLNVPKVGGALGQIWNLADVRVGAHEDRLRLVLEMQESGDTAPKYRVVEVSNAASPFPGTTDAEWGAARIDLLVSDLYARDISLSEILPMEFTDDPVVTRIGRYPTADDALFGLSIGLSEPTEYEVYELAEPVRVVVDILYP
jgi:hypothetical protein